MGQIITPIRPAKLRRGRFRVLPSPPPRRGGACCAGPPQPVRVALAAPESDVLVVEQTIIVKCGLRVLLLPSSVRGHRNVRRVSASGVAGISEQDGFKIQQQDSSSDYPASWTTPFAARQLLCFWLEFPADVEGISPHTMSLIGRPREKCIQFMGLTLRRQMNRRHSPTSHRYRGRDTGKAAHALGRGGRRDGERIHMSRRSAPLATSTGINLSDDLGEDDARWATTRVPVILKSPCLRVCVQLLLPNIAQNRISATSLLSHLRHLLPILMGSSSGVWGKDVERASMRAVEYPQATNWGWGYGENEKVNTMPVDSDEVSEKEWDSDRDGSGRGSSDLESDEEEDETKSE
ncbi:hypothetical protein B0H14DRAFT_3132868 [Mycena olivaceomarginata]|nr:hypothetical protein B0H14DRAFT_3132868 [Mycena olivaceomarginata]